MVFKAILQLQHCTVQLKTESQPFLEMSSYQQQAGCSNPSDETRFSPASTPFQQTGGESGYTPYPSYMVPSPQMGYRSFQQTPQQYTGSLNPQYNLQMTGCVNPTNSPYQMSYTDAHLDSSFGPGQCQMFSGNVQPHQQQLEPPYNTSLNSGARYDMTPTTPSFPNQVPCTPVRNKAEIISPFTPPQIHKDSQGDEIPKFLNYDPTKKPWEVFNQDFCRHARNKYWTSMECKSNFHYVLEGEAAEYFAALNQREPDLPFFDVLSKMRDRFKGRDSQETSQPVFHNKSPDQMNDSWVRQSQPDTFRESTPVHNIHLFGANTPVYPTFHPQLWSNALPEPPPITPRMERYILYKGPPSPNTSKQDGGQKESSEQYEEQESTSKQDADQKEICSSESKIDDRMTKLEEKFVKMMETMIKANESKFEETKPSPPSRRSIGCEAIFEEPQPSPPPRRVVITERSLPQTLSRCIGCNKEGHYLWDCPNEKKVLFKEQQPDKEDLNYKGSDLEA